MRRRIFCPTFLFDQQVAAMINDLHSSFKPAVRSDRSTEERIENKRLHHLREARRCGKCDASSGRGKWRIRGLCYRQFRDKAETRVCSAAPDISVILVDMP